jgi:hypothetical protein
MKPRSCTHCGSTYPLDAEHFFRNAENRSGFESVCKVCRGGSIERGPQRQLCPGGGDEPGSAQTLRPEPPREELPTPLMCTCDTRDAQAPMHAVDCELRENYDPEDICPTCGALLEPVTGPGDCTVCRRSELPTLSDEREVPR